MWVHTAYRAGSGGDDRTSDEGGHSHVIAGDGVHLGQRHGGDCDRGSSLTTGVHAVTYKVGSADEEPGKTGLAHFFEHLMFKGTTKYPKDSFDLILDENGAERNAFTTLETTFYYVRSHAALLAQIMDLESDRMQNLVLTPEVFETERKVVQEERRMRTESDPFGLAYEKLNAALFKVHPYGRPVIGYPETWQN